MAALAGQAVAYLLELRRKVHKRYHDLPYNGKVVLWVWVALHVAGIATMAWITPSRFFNIMAGWATSLREAQYGWILLLSLIVLTSLPPLMGYGTTITLCGFAYGVNVGWLIGSTGCLAGALVSFVITRRLLSVFAPLLAQDQTFRALARAVRVKGLPLVILIRLCPFPFPYSNAFFASIETVTLWQFFVATLAITPKLLLHVWVGSRMYLFADEESRQKMDFNTKLINGIYVAIGSILGMGTSYYVYKLTMHYVEELGGLEEGDVDLEAGLIADVDAMLEEDELDEHDPDAGSVPLLPKRSPRVAVAPLVEAPPRESEDRWEGAFSDFDERVSVEETDPPSAGLSRPPAVTVSSTDTVKPRDKRAD